MLLLSLYPLEAQHLKFNPRVLPLEGHRPVGANTCPTLHAVHAVLRNHLRADHNPSDALSNRFRIPPPAHPVQRGNPSKDGLAPSNHEAALARSLFQSTYLYRDGLRCLNKAVIPASKKPPPSPSTPGTVRTTRSTAHANTLGIGSNDKDGTHGGSCGMMITNEQAGDFNATVIESPNSRDKGGVRGSGALRSSNKPEREYSFKAHTPAPPPSLPNIRSSADAGPSISFACKSAVAIEGSSSAAAPCEVASSRAGKCAWKPYESNKTGSPRTETDLSEILRRYDVVHACFSV